MGQDEDLVRVIAEGLEPPLDQKASQAVAVAVDVDVAVEPSEVLRGVVDSNLDQFAREVEGAVAGAPLATTADLPTEVEGVH